MYYYFFFIFFFTLLQSDTPDCLLLAEVALKPESKSKITKAVCTGPESCREDFTTRINDSCAG